MDSRKRKASEYLLQRVRIAPNFQRDQRKETEILVNQRLLKLFQQPSFPRDHDLDDCDSGALH